MKMDLKVLSMSDVMDRLDHDEELFYELVSDFFNDFDKVWDSLKSAIAESNFDVMHDAGHSLKGALLTIGAEIAGDKAKQIEAMGKNKSLEGVDSLIEEVKSSIGDYFNEVKKCAIESDYGHLISSLSYAPN